MSSPTYMNHYVSSYSRDRASYLPSCKLLYIDGELSTAHTPHVSHLHKYMSIRFYNKFLLSVAELRLASIVPRGGSSEKCSIACLNRSYPGPAKRCSQPPSAFLTAAGPPANAVYGMLDREEPKCRAKQCRCRRTCRRKLSRLEVRQEGRPWERRVA